MAKSEDALRVEYAWDQSDGHCQIFPEALGPFLWRFELGPCHMEQIHGQKPFTFSHEL